MEAYREPFLRGLSSPSPSAAGHGQAQPVLTMLVIVEGEGHAASPGEKPRRLPRRLASCDECSGGEAAASIDRMRGNYALCRDNRMSLFPQSIADRFPILDP